MRIWHQSFTVLEDVPLYRDALAAHLSEAAAEGAVVDLHGMAPGTYPTNYPGTHIGYNYLLSLHKEQFVRAALRAEDEGYDAFYIATIPDTGFEEIRSLVDIPVVAYGQSSLLFAATLGNPVGVVNFIGALEPHIRRNATTFGLGQLLGPVVTVDIGFDELMEGFSDPAGVLDKVTAGARAARDQGAQVLVPGEGPLNVLLARLGISELAGLPVVDSLGVGIKICLVRAGFRSTQGLVPARSGFFYGKPPRELLDQARRWYFGETGTSGVVTGAASAEEQP